MSVLPHPLTVDPKWRELTTVEANGEEQIVCDEQTMTYDVDDMRLCTPMSVLSGLVSGFCERQAVVSTVMGIGEWQQTADAVLDTRNNAPLVSACAANVALGNTENMYTPVDPTFTRIVEGAGGTYMQVFDNMLNNLITTGGFVTQNGVPLNTFETVAIAASTMAAEEADKSNDSTSSIGMPALGNSYGDAFAPCLPIEWARERKWMLEQLRWTGGGESNEIARAYLYDDSRLINTETVSVTKPADAWYPMNALYLAALMKSSKAQINDLYTVANYDMFKDDANNSMYITSKYGFLTSDYEVTLVDDDLRYVTDHAVTTSKPVTVYFGPGDRNVVDYAALEYLDESPKIAVVSSSYVVENGETLILQPAVGSHVPDGTICVESGGTLIWSGCDCLMGWGCLYRVPWDSYYGTISWTSKYIMPLTDVSDAVDTVNVTEAGDVDTFCVQYVIPPVIEYKIHNDATDEDIIEQRTTGIIYVHEEEAWIPREEPDENGWRGCYRLYEGRYEWDPGYGTYQMTLNESEQIPYTAGMEHEIRWRHRVYASAAGTLYILKDRWFLSDPTQAGVKWGGCKYLNIVSGGSMIPVFNGNTPTGLTNMSVSGMSMHYEYEDVYAYPGYYYADKPCQYIREEEAQSTVPVHTVDQMAAYWVAGPKTKVVLSRSMDVESQTILVYAEDGAEVTVKGNLRARVVAYTGALVTLMDNTALAGCQVFKDATLKIDGSGVHIDGGAEPPVDHIYSGGSYVISGSSHYSGAPFYEFDEGAYVEIGSGLRLREITSDNKVSYVAPWSPVMYEGSESPVYEVDWFTATLPDFPTLGFGDIDITMFRNFGLSYKVPGEDARVLAKTGWNTIDLVVTGAQIIDEDDGSISYDNYYRRGPLLSATNEEVVNAQISPVDETRCIRGTITFMRGSTEETENSYLVLRRHNMTSFYARLAIRAFNKRPPGRTDHYPNFNLRQYMTDQERYAVEHAAAPAQNSEEEDGEDGD